MGGADQCKVHIHRLAAAQRYDLVVLQHAQQPRLQRQGHVADFIEKQRAPLRLAHAAQRAFTPRAGKGTGGVAKQLGFNQVFRQRGAIDGHKRAGAARADGVGGACKQLLADAGFALNQQSNRLAADATQLVGRAAPACIAGVEPGQCVFCRGS